MVVRLYDGQGCVNSGDYNAGHASALYDNKCVIPNKTGRNTDGEVVDANVGSACNGQGGSQSGNLQAWNNSFYTPIGNATVMCGRTAVRLVDVKPPFEKGSQSFTLPSPLQISQWGREKILMA